jgi:acetyl esterase/lipase
MGWTAILTVPRPQSEELHMALKQRGVPTEFFVHPGNTHGIPDPRNQYLKAGGVCPVRENGSGKPWFTWKESARALTIRRLREEDREP